MKNVKTFSQECMNIIDNLNERLFWTLNYEYNMSRKCNFDNYHLILNILLNIINETGTNLDCNDISIIIQNINSNIYSVKNKCICYLPFNKYVMTESLIYNANCNGFFIGIPVYYHS